MHFQVFPAVTICNTYPLNNTRSDQLSWEQYQSLMKSKKFQWSYELLKKLAPGVKKDAYDYLWRHLSSPSAYFSSLPVTNYWEERTVEDVVIVECLAYSWDWMVDHNIKCSREPVLQTRWDPDYHRCYTIRIPDNSKRASSRFAHEAQM